MTLIALIAAAEAMLYSASRSKWSRAQREQDLTGNSLDSVHALPLIDEYLRRKTAGAGRIQTFVASKCWQKSVVELFTHGRSSTSSPHVIRTAILKRRRKLSISHSGVTL